MTTDVVETIRQLQFLGRKLSSDGKQLTVGDGGEIGAELMEAIKAHREALIAIFTPPADAAEREAIQWAERQPNPEADAALTQAVAEWSTGEASAFITGIAEAFPGCRIRPLSQAEYDAIGFRDGQARPAAEASEPRQPTPRRGEWLAMRSEIELRIGGTPTVINAGEGVQRIVSLDEIADGFDLDSMKQAAELYRPRGMIAVWVRGIHPAFIEPELLGLQSPSA